ncbi:calcium-binding protein [Methyloradius palustris]|uniref:Haemolysin-type calcium binding-related domain-containing protein n=1 Tax=Methyloradius palustris TaxID=2778876 RepID=A0A8D5G873_9PROT|nr:calcium-binding protein [Methyloradius palustris]BCM24952.1 hypothetical protein ZMTM_12110 [Methyloradius palustris]
MDYQDFGDLVNNINGIFDVAKSANTPGRSDAQQAADALEAASVISTTMSLLSTFNPMIPGFPLSNGAINLLNLEAQGRLMDEAIASGDQEAIIQTSLDFGAAIAGALGSVPTPIAGYLKVISLDFAAASALYKNRQAIEDFFHDLVNPNPATPSKPPLIPIHLPMGDADGNGIPDIHEGHWINVKTSFDNLANSPQRSDPFTLDLNGNGIDTVGISTTNPILFDIDADGVKTSTGWIAATDGLLVLDRNGNDTIDNGRELFGDATLKTNGQLAADGFDAIADQDTNHDGIISNLDANWNNLRVWRDLNQDGISQANELVTLNSLGIASINVTGQDHSTLLNDGNVLADLGTFTYANGTNGTAGTAANLADVNLVQDTFTSQFTDHIPLTTQAATLPNLQGSGQVRDLQEAASLSPTLANLLTQFATASRADQHALMDQILKAWSDTSTMATTFTGAYAGHTLTVDMQAAYTGLAVGSAGYQAMADKLTVMEHFNGRTYQPIPTGTGAVTLTLWHVAQDLLNQSYDVLKQSVYQSLHQAAIYDTLVKPLLDEVQLSITDAGISLDFTALNADLNARITANSTAGIQDLLDFYIGTKDTLKDSGWQGQQMIVDFLASHTITPDINTALLDAGFSVKGYTGWNNGYGSSADDFMVADDQADTLNGGAGDDALLGMGGNDQLSGGDGNDTLEGGAGNDGLAGSEGNDVLLGGSGDDGLNGGNGNDTLIGGTGNDYLFGGDGADVYQFSTGDGADYILNSDDGYGASVDTIKFTDVTSTQLRSVVRSGYDLILNYGTSDSITAGNHFNNSFWSIGQVQFSDGVTMNMAQLFEAYALNLTDGADNVTFNGATSNLHILGGDGNDQISTGLGNDTLEGGAGNDGLAGSEGNDVLLGGSGDDGLNGGNGNDTLIGGTGNDYLFGGDGTDVYQFSTGDGTDYILNSDDGYGASVDTIKFTDVTSTQLTSLTRVGNDLVINYGVSDSITAGNHFANTFWSMGQVQFSDGVTMSMAQLFAAYAINLTNDADNASFGDISNLHILAGDGSDRVTTSSGNDTLDGGNGDDILSSAAGNDILLGGSGNDQLSGGDDNDTLIGGTGDDNLNGGNGNDTLIGGTGNDYLFGGDGADVYQFTTGDGTDYILNSDDGYGASVDTIKFTDVTSTQLRSVVRSGYDLILNYGTSDSITAGNHFNNSFWSIGQVQFSDGVTMNMAQLFEAYALNLTDGADNVTFNGATSNLHILGGDGNDQISTGLGNDTLEGGAGNDGLAGSEGNDVLLGGSGDDGLNGGNGNDTLIGGTGNDYLFGGDGADVYQFSTGDGADYILNSDDGYGASVDTIKFTDVTSTQLRSVVRSGYDLILNYGTSDSITAGNHFNNSFWSIGQVQFSDGVTMNMAQLFEAYALNLTDGADNVTFNGATSNLHILGGDGNDQISTGLGNDTLEGGAGNDGLAGSEGNDVLLGGSGDDGLNGGNGNDTLIGGTGNDYLFGGDGADVYQFSTGDGTDYILNSDDGYGASVDTIKFTDVTSTQLTSLTRVGNDLVINYGVSDSITAGNHFANTFWSMGQVQFSDGVTMSMAQLFAAYPFSFTLTTGNDNVSFAGYGSVKVYADAGNDTIIGTSGNDTLDGGTGADYLYGGAGNDTYVVDNIGDVVSESANAGIDTVQSSITYTLTDNVENLTLTGTTAINGTGNALDNYLTGNSTINILTGGAGNDTLDGGLGNDTLIGGIGDDTYIIDTKYDVITENAGEGTDTVQSNFSYTIGNNLENLTLTGTAAINGTGNSLNNVLIGNANYNVLDGGAGVDTMIGGSGNDTYVVDNAGDVVIENAAEGTDTVQSSITYTLGANVENLTLTGTLAINGTGNELNNIMIGNSAANILIGGAGNDNINGGTGADTLIGGTGNDTYVVDDAGDVITEYDAEGTDLVQSSINYTLTANVENLTLTGTAAINGTGNELANTLTGNTAANILNGGAGNDTLNGGAGTDTMIGGTGDDTYIVDNTGDVITENAGEGTDNVQASVTYTLSANLENLTLTGTAAINGTGNDLNNLLVGTTAANYLQGGAGNDTLQGNYGYDTLDGGLGIDTVTYAGTWTGIQINLAAGTATGGAATGNVLLNIENIIGSGANDLITGDAGNNVLDGSLGADTLIGGLGDDIYYLDSTGDVVTENANEGTDSVFSTFSYTLGANVENLTIIYSSNQNATGNELNNILTTTLGNNTLDGKAGADTMSGGIGNDTYVVDNAGDLVIENAGEGTDLVQSSITYTLTDNVENLALTGTANINGTGNTLNNTLTGNAGNNILDGGLGADTMSGGAGNDTYIVDNLGDVVTEAANAGTDTVNVALATVGGTYTVVTNVENATLINTVAYNLTGNSGNNVLIGNASNNILNGVAGADSMLGGLGDDTYVVDNVADVVTEYAGEGTDTVLSSITYTLGNNLENLTLTGTAALNGTGNSLDNVLTGNSGANSLTGGAGNDTFIGGLGADTLTGGTGNDTYQFTRGDGADTIVENDATAGNTDVLKFTSGTSYDQLWFKHVANNLEISIIGTTDKTIIKDWYTATDNHVEQITTVDGSHTLLDTQVQNLVNAMAGLTPPAAGQTTLPAAYQTQLAPVLAANWS